MPIRGVENLKVKRQFHAALEEAVLYKLQVCFAKPQNGPDTELIEDPLDPVVLWKPRVQEFGYAHHRPVANIHPLGQFTKPYDCKRVLALLFVRRHLGHRRSQEGNGESVHLPQIVEALGCKDYAFVEIIPRQRRLGLRLPERGELLEMILRQNTTSRDC